jgi:hypothetical protein
MPFENSGNSIAAQCPQSPGETASSFLKWLDPVGLHNLVSLDPQTGALSAKTFPANAFEAVSRWVDERAGKLNLYYTVNEVKPGTGDKKPSASDIASIRAVWVDKDPADSGDLTADRIAALQELQARPGFAEAALIDSGGGYQMLAVFRNKLPADADTCQWAEAHGLGLAVALDADHVQDVPRMLRLPGPDNIPTPAKAAKGRVQRAAAIVSMPPRRFSRAEIEAAVEPIWSSEGRDNDPRISQVTQDLRRVAYMAAAEFADLPDELRARFAASCQQSPKLAALWAGVAPPGDKTGSGYRAALAGRLGRAGGYTAEDYAHLVWVWRYAVQAKDEPIRESKLTERTLAREWVRCGETDAASPDSFFSVVGDIDLVAAGWNAETGPNSDGPRLLPTITLDQAAATALEMSSAPLVHSLLDKETLNMLYGASNTGKTFVALDMAFCIGHGMPWAGLETEKTGVLYVAAEGGRGIRKRSRALTLQYPGVSGANFNLITSPIDLLDAKADLAPLIATIEDITARSGPVGFLVLDTLSRVLPGGKEDTADMGAFVARGTEITDKTGCAVLIIHHSGKDEARGARGSSVLRAAVATELEIKDGRVAVTKQRDLEPIPDLCFELKGVSIGLDAQGREVTSAVASFMTAGSVPVKKLTDAETRVLDALKEIVEQFPLANGASPKQIADILSGRGAVITSEGVRAHLKNLTKKGFASPGRRGCWVPKTGKTGNSTLLQPIAEEAPSMLPNAATGAQSGMGVFQ